MPAATAPMAVEEPTAPGDRLPRSGAPGEPSGAAQRRRLALLVALLCGVLLRLLQYGVNRSLWLDEALLVDNFLPRSWAGLLRPLDRGQTAPIGFLAAEKALATLLGGSEYVLRLLPLLAGLATLALIPRVARRYVTRPAFPLAVAIVAVAPYLVYYSSEVKQYALDAFVSTVVLGFAAALARRPHDRRVAIGFAAAGVVALWFSQPAVFMLAGCGTVLGVRALRRGDRRGVRTLAVLAAAWAASFAGSFLISHHEVADPEYMRSFWRDGFFPLPPRTLSDWLWLPRNLAHVFREPVGIIGEDASAVSVIGWGAALLAFAAGAAWMWRHRRLRLALLLAPAGFAIAAAVAHQYPFGGRYLAGGRVLVFLLPSLACVMAEGAAASGRWLRGRGGSLAFALLAAGVLLPSAAYAALSVPHVRAEVKPLLQYAEENRRPGDVLYVYYNGASVWEYYRDRYPWPAGDVVAGRCSRFDPVGYLADVDRLRGRPRVWMLFVGGEGVNGFKERKLMVSYLDLIGRRLDDRVAVGAYLYLYDLRNGVAAPGRLKATLPRYPYDVALDCRGPWEPR